VRVLALVVLVACGGGHHGPAGDADDQGGDVGSGMADAPIDVPFVRGTVHVQVTNASSAAADCMPNLHVAFEDVDGTLTDVVADASGNAQADVFPGASVTAVCERSSGNYSIVTVQDVEPSDMIVLDAARFFTGTQPADQTTAGTFKISYPADSGATNYTVYYPCGNVVSSSTNNVSLPMTAGCLLLNMDLVVVAGNNSGPIAYAEAKNVAFTNNGSTTVTDTWHPLISVAATYANPPAFCADSTNPDYPCDVQLQRFVPDMHGFRATGMTNVASGAATINVTVPSAMYAAMQTRLENNGPAYQVITSYVPGTGASYSVDFASELLPWMCLGEPQCPMFSGTDAKLTIPVVGTATYDLFEADVTYSRGPAFTTIYVWRIFGPTAGDVTFPHLPPSIASVRPTSADRQSVTHARIGESLALGSWQAARQNPFDSLATCLQSTDPTAPRYPGPFHRVSASQ
jgi:hypothetical protein